MANFSSLPSWNLKQNFHIYSSRLRGKSIPAAGCESTGINIAESTLVIEPQGQYDQNSFPAVISYRSQS